MIQLRDFSREAAFLAKQRYVLVFLAAAFLLSVFATWSGLHETNNQQATIERLLEKDAEDRSDVLSQHNDYGSVAYYSFHLTYSEPSELSFAAIGQRDVFPWKHRVRMLALEGQIYESDADNPELSFLGRFDFAFLVSVLLPLFVILLLHDVRSSERESGRLDLILVTANKPQAYWLARALVLCTALALVLLMPFLITAFINAAKFTDILMMSLIVLGHILFWMLVTLKIGAKDKRSSTQIASTLLGIWLIFTVLIPVVSDTVINKLVHGPNGGEIVLNQREAVNDAWDLPFSATWDEFLKTHPQWADKTDMDPFFEWKWYYAFQQVGDQKTAELSKAYRIAIERKDNYAAITSILSPAMLSQRLMSSVARTDIKASMAYEKSVRDYHASLREFYYPLLFNDEAFSHEVLKELPQFTPRR